MKRCVQLLVFLCVAPVMSMDSWSEVSDGSLIENCYRVFLRDVRMRLDEIRAEKEIYRDKAIQWEYRTQVLQQIKMKTEEKKQFHEWAIEQCEREPWDINPVAARNWALHKWEVRCLESREIAATGVLQYAASQSDWFRKALNSLDVDEKVLFDMLAESTCGSFTVSQEDIFSQKDWSERSEWF